MSILSLIKPLPYHFQRQGFLDFHGRDSESIAERCSGNIIEKGLFWQDEAAVISFNFNQIGQVLILLDIPREVTDADKIVLSELADHMLGLDQDVDTFEAQCIIQNSPMSSLVKQQMGLRIPQSASPFEAFSWAIIGQQISVKAAISIRRRFIQAFGAQHSSGLMCYPTAKSLSQVVPEDLQATGFSKAKAAALLLLSEHIRQGKLIWPSQPDRPAIESLTEQLLALKGIGPWTVSYGLLRGFSWLDGSLHGDVALRRNLSTLLKSSGPLDAKATEQWLANYSPWRALVGAHLWAMDSEISY